MACTIHFFWRKARATKKKPVRYVMDWKLVDDGNHETICSTKQGYEHQNDAGMAAILAFGTDRHTFGLMPKKPRMPKPVNQEV